MTERFSLHFPSLVYICVCVCVKSLQSCLTLCIHMDHSFPGFHVHGILQARILEWVAVPSSRGIFLTQGWNQHLLGQVGSFTTDATCLHNCDSKSHRKDGLGHSDTDHWQRLGTTPKDASVYCFPGPANGTLFGKRVFADGRILRWRGGPALFKLALNAPSESF